MCIGASTRACGSDKRGKQAPLPCVFIRKRAVWFGPRIRIQPPLCVTLSESPFSLEHMALNRYTVYELIIEDFIINMAAEGMYRLLEKILGFRYILSDEGISRNGQHS